MISYERIAVYGKIVVYCEINETILGPCSGGIWTLVMKIKGSEVGSVKQILQLNPIVFLLKAFSYPETPVSLIAMMRGNCVRKNASVLKISRVRDNVI